MKMSSVAIAKDLTTGQISKITGNAPRTVSNWIDSGLLKGYRVPSSKDRRVRPDDLVDFLRRNGMTERIPLINGGGTRVLFVGFPESTAHALAAAPYEARFAASGVAGGMAIATYRPMILVVDSAVGRIDGQCLAVAAKSMGARTIVIGDHIAGFDANGKSIGEMDRLILMALSVGA